MSNQQVNEIKEKFFKTTEEYFLGVIDSLLDQDDTAQELRTDSYDGSTSK